MSSTATATQPIGFSNSYQVSSFFRHYFFCSFYDKLNQVAQQNSIVQWLSPVIGITDGIVKLITIIGSIFEATIKGIGNVALGTITLNAGLLINGSLQLVFLIPVRVISILPHLLITLLLTNNLMFDPEETTKIAAEWYRKETTFF